VLFDGNAIVHRAYHAFQNTRPLTVSRTGELVSAVYGFAGMLLKVINELKPTHCAIAFDRKAPTFRHQLFDQYKAHRPETPGELVDQLGRVRQMVETFGIPIYEIDGFEADDVLGTLSQQAVVQDIDTVIVTGDADAMQLVNPHVRVLYPRPGKPFSDTMLFSEADVREKYGVRPDQIADLKALEGDPSDNIPGVPGVGEKTAVKLLSEFGSVEQLYTQIDKVAPARIQEILKQNEETARRCKELATIVTDVPLSLDLEQCRLSQFDRNKVAELFRELEFYSLLAKLPEVDSASEEPSVKVEASSLQNNYQIVNTESALHNLVQKLSASSSFAFDTETTGLNAMTAGLVGVSLALSPGEAYYVPVGHIGLDTVTQLPLPVVVAALKAPLEDEKIAKIAQNGKYDMTVLAGCGINVKNLQFDTMLAAYLLGEKAFGLKTLAFSRLHIEMKPITDLIGSGTKQVPMSHVDIKSAADYSCADADMTLRLMSVLKSDLEKQEELWPLFSDVEMPLVPVLMAMERNGVALDRDLLGQMSRELGEQVLALEKQIYENVGHQFNINSPKQLGPVLFDELHLPGRKSKGSYSTEASVLEALRGVHPVIEQILEYRQLTKLKSTYIDALPDLINPATGRVHTSFNQTRTTTGRLSSSDPNLQNIPVRGDVGRKIRRAFIAPPGCKLLGADYSQIDLRALAHLSQDEGLLAAFNRDEDIHAATAAQLFGVERTAVTGDMRRLAKTVNFGVIYGMSEYGLEQATDLSREEAGKFITAYFEKYPGVRKYLESTREQARRQGYVQTILGRRRYIPEINSANRQVREAAERMAINMPVQGTSADIIKVAMINLYIKMVQRGLQSKMLLQVHDELIFEVPQEELAEMRQLVSEVMSTAITLSVPLKVDTKVGANWGEME